MRLDFNIAFIDDEIDSDDSDAVDELIDKVESYIRDKGFNPVSRKYQNSKSCIDENNQDRRIDLYISDNNLSTDETGIKLYLSLKSGFICDFILYTRSDKTDIINTLIENLQKVADPNIFTRFTFITRTSTDEWHEEVYNVIDHIISKREELNSLRGLYAQVSARIHNRLREALKDQKIAFKEAVELAFSRKIISNKLDKDFKRHLLNLIENRNGLIHQDETRDQVTGKYKISYYIGKNDKTEGKLIEIKEDDFSELRKKVFSIKKRFLLQLPDK